MSSRRQERVLQDYFSGLLSVSPDSREPTLELEKSSSSVEVSSSKHELKPAMAENKSSRSSLLPEFKAVDRKPVADARLARLLAPVGEPIAETVITAEPSIADEVTNVVHSVPDVIPHSRVTTESPAPEPIDAAIDADEDNPAHVVDPILAAIQNFRADLPSQFHAIVFRVDELKLALPLHLLGGIQKREKTITPLPGKPSWFMGLLQHEPENLNVVDTGRYLLQQRFNGNMLDDYQFVIVIGNTQWGLACHELYDTIEVKTDDISWFAAAERRPWLAGMLRHEMCALLNADALTLLLHRGLLESKGLTRKKAVTQQ